MCEDKFEQYMKEERRYLYERINLLRLFKRKRTIART